MAAETASAITATEERRPTSVSHRPPLIRTSVRRTEAAVRPAICIRPSPRSSSRPLARRALRPRLNCSPSCSTRSNSIRLFTRPCPLRTDQTNWPNISNSNSSSNSNNSSSCNTNTSSTCFNNISSNNNNNNNKIMAPVAAACRLCLYMAMRRPRSSTRSFCTRRLLLTRRLMISC